MNDCVKYSTYCTYIRVACASYQFCESRLRPLPASRSLNGRPFQSLFVAWGCPKVDACFRGWGGGKPNFQRNGSKSPVQPPLPIVVEPVHRVWLGGGDSAKPPNTDLNNSPFLFAHKKARQEISLPKMDKLQSAVLPIHAPHPRPTPPATSNPGSSQWRRRCRTSAASV